MSTVNLNLKQLQNNLFALLAGVGTPDLTDSIGDIWIDSVKREDGTDVVFDVTAHPAAEGRGWIREYTLQIEDETPRGITIDTQTGLVTLTAVADYTAVVGVTPENLNRRLL